MHPAPDFLFFRVVVMVSKKELVDAVCIVCDFYKETEEQLECGAYRIIRVLLEREKITLEDIRLAGKEVSETG
jgi:hypothetical protein